MDIQKAQAEVIEAGKLVNKSKSSDKMSNCGHTWENTRRKILVHTGFKYKADTPGAARPYRGKLIHHTLIISPPIL